MVVRKRSSHAGDRERNFSTRLLVVADFSTKVDNYIIIKLFFKAIIRSVNSLSIFQPIALFRKAG